MTRWTVAGALLLVAGGLATVALARFCGRSGSRASVLVSVVSAWLGAWVLWSFAAALALRWGVLETYDGLAFAALAVAGGVWQYRTHVARGRDRALTVFVAGQLVWLGVVLVRNGLLGTG